MKRYFLTIFLNLRLQYWHFILLFMLTDGLHAKVAALPCPSFVLFWTYLQLLLFFKSLLTLIHSDILLSYNSRQPTFLCHLALFLFSVSYFIFRPSLSHIGFFYCFPFVLLLRTFAIVFLVSSLGVPTHPEFLLNSLALGLFIITFFFEVQDTHLAALGFTFP